MTRMAIVVGMMTAGLLMVSPDAAATPGLAEQSTPRVTAAEAAPFIGEWTLNLQGDNGPATLDLAVTAEKDTVAGTITGPAGAAQPISDVTKAEKSLVLSYSFDYEGTPVDAVVRLTPEDKGEMNAEIVFAGGAYVMSGTAARKEKTRGVAKP